MCVCVCVCACVCACVCVCVCGDELVMLVPNLHLPSCSDHHPVLIALTSASCRARHPCLPFPCCCLHFRVRAPTPPTPCFFRLRFLCRYATPRHVYHTSLQRRHLRRLRMARLLGVAHRAADALACHTLRRRAFRAWISGAAAVRNARRAKAWYGLVLQGRAFRALAVGVKRRR